MSRRPRSLVRASAIAMRVVAAVIALTILVGLIIQLSLLFTGGADVNSGEAGSAIPTATRLARLVSFFTVDSNLLVLGVAVASAVRGTRGGAVWRVIQLDALLSIAVTGSVFSLLLDPSIQLRDAAVVVNALFHVVVPIAFVGWWLLWGPRRSLELSTVLWSFVWPLLWLGFTFARGAITGWYPYPVLDVGKVGIGAALLTAIAVLALAAVYAAVAMGIDRWVPALRVTERAGPDTASPERP